MFNTVFHTSSLRLLPAILAHAFGPTLFLLWVPLACIGAVWFTNRAAAGSSTESS